MNKLLTFWFGLSFWQSAPFWNRCLWLILQWIRFVRLIALHIWLASHKPTRKFCGLLNKSSTHVLKKERKKERKRILWAGNFHICFITLGNLAFFKISIYDFIPFSIFFFFFAKQKEIARTINAYYLFYIYYYRNIFSL